LLPPADRAALQLVLDNVVADFRRQPQSTAASPGITAAVVTSRGSWSGAAGTGGDGIPLAADAMMNIASITKTFTAAEVIHLSQQGTVDLDAPASQYLDHPLLVRHPTVRQLLSMQSGIPEFTKEPFVAAVMATPSKSWTSPESLSYANGQLATPGTGFTYTNSNYLLLGLLIEKVTNTTYAAALHRDLLHGTTVWRVAVQDNEAPTPPLGAPSKDAGALPSDPYLPTRAWASSTTAAGGIAADAASVARWGYDLYGGRLLPPYAVREMTTAGPGGYGLGTEVAPLPNLGTDEGHIGVTAGYTSALIVVPERQTAVSVLIPHDSDAHRIASMLVTALLTPR
jgi:CubicO group peptidase (beta-lactamase class C family)